MSKAERLRLGVLGGLLLALILHPFSRSLILDGLRFGPSPVISRSTLVATNFEQMPPAKDVATARLWMEVGATEILHSKKLTERQIADFVSVAHNFGRKDPENAFWPMLEAAFLSNGGDSAQAENKWIQASKLRNWSDPQDGLLVSTVYALSPEPRAWQWALMLSLRSQETTKLLERYAREISRRHLLVAEDLTPRLASLRNGDLIRNGTKQIATGQIGVNIAEIATFPNDVAPLLSPRKLVVARNDFAVLLKSRSTTDEELAQLVFRANDAFMALVAADTEEESNTMSVSAALVGSIPGALIGVSLASGLLWFLATRFGQALGRDRWISPIVIVPLALTLSAIAYWTTHYPFASIGVALSILSLLIQPRLIRSAGRPVLGTTITILLQFLGLLMILLLTQMLVGLATPCWEMGMYTTWLSEVFGFTSLTTGLLFMVGSFAIMLSFVLATSYRLSTGTMLAEILRILGRTMCFLGLVLAVAFSVGALAWERQIRAPLKEMVLNEPVHALKK